MSTDLCVRDIAVVALLLICLLSDVKSRRIPNWATLPGIALGLMLNLVLGGWPGLRMSAIGAGVGFGALFLLFMLGWMGGGDVKLMAAIGALKGYPFVVSALVYSILVGGFIGIAVLVWNRRFWPAMKGIALFLLSRVFRSIPTHELDPEKMQKVPFGIAIVVGTVWAGVVSHFAGPLWPFM